MVLVRCTCLRFDLWTLVLMMWLLLIWGALIALWMAVEQYEPVSKVRGLARRLATRFAAEPAPPRALRD